jgi:hypothetical protein
VRYKEGMAIIYLVTGKVTDFDTDVQFHVKAFVSSERAEAHAESLNRAAKLFRDEVAKWTETINTLYPQRYSVLTPRTQEERERIRRERVEWTVANPRPKPPEWIAPDAHYEVVELEVEGL